ncbi:MAG TPA: NfuA family Fe-S biogenesis protein [Xanthomonadaceae bacterium]|nr:NfuA family Fe-S biogenesis protein [Xanthomonadaceae bacterium]
MIHISPVAQKHFQRLIEQQGEDGLGIRLSALRGGTPAADCHLEFCAGADLAGDEWAVDCEGFTLWVDAASVAFLDGAEIDLREEGAGTTLSIRAPALKGEVPGMDASLVERVRYVMESEINPGVASHGGRVQVEEVRADGTVVLRFGGGCHGCGMVDVTLKQGIEKTLMARIPEVTAVVDATDHSTGENPYVARAG